MMNYNIDNKINWFTDITGAQSYKDIVLPSVTKSVEKDGPSLAATFDYHLEPITEQLFTEYFIPCYKKYVVSKEFYHLDEAERYATLLERFSDEQYGKYYLLWITKKGALDVLYGVSLFRIRPEFKSLSVVHKGFDHQITRELDVKTSLDYWTESIVQNFAIAQGCTILSHGKDLHFRKNPGVFMFKFKIGCRPVSSLISSAAFLNREGVKQITITQEDIEANNLSVFFDLPDENGLFARMNVFYKQASGKPELFHELEKNAQRAGLEVNSTIY